MELSRESVLFLSLHPNHMKLYVSNYASVELWRTSYNAHVQSETTYLPRRLV